MENILFKYSDFFEDDGGMQKVKSDFEKLGNDLISEAKKVKKEVADTFNFDDLEGFKKMEAKVEDLVKATEKYENAKISLAEIEAEIIKAQKKETDSLEDLADAIDTNTEATEENVQALKDRKKATVESTKALDKLYVEMEQHKVALKVTNELEKQGLITIEDASVARGRARLMMKELTKEINKQEKELLALNEVSKKEQKLLEAKIVVENKQIDTLEEVRERMSALRLVVQSLDYKKEAEKIQAYNQEIDELTEILSENSDKFIQNKINVGNYEESIKNALKESSLFKTNIVAIDSALDGFLGGIMKSRKEIEEMEEALGTNANALQRFQISFGKLNKVLKASVIGLVLVALAGMASLFGSTRAGAVRMEKTMMALTSAFQTFGKVSLAVLKGLGKGIYYLVQLKFDEAGEAVKESMEGITEAFANGTEAVIKGLEYIDRAFKLEDNVRRLSREVERLNGQLSIAQLKADDATRSFKSQTRFNAIALGLQNQIGAKNLQIAKDNLEIINNKIKQNALANVEEAKSLNLQAQGVAFAEQVQALAQRRGVDLEISNELIEEQQSALLEVIQVENEIALAREENAKKQREINQDLFEQNLDLLIDLIDTEKNISESYVNNVKKNFQNRINEFNRFIVQFRNNAKQEIEEFNKLFKANDISAKFKVEFDDENNVKVFLNGVELSLESSLDAITKLNSQLQSAGIAEIPINRFREFLVEARNGKRDFDALAESLRDTGYAIKELEANLNISTDTYIKLTKLEDKIRDLTMISNSRLSIRQRRLVLKDIEQLEKEKELIKTQAERESLEARKKAIDEELSATYLKTVDGQQKEFKVVEEGSERYYELLKERFDIENGIKDKQAEEELKKTKDANDKAIAEYEKFIQEVQNIINMVLDKILEVNQKRIQEQEKLVSKQEDIISRQEERAQQGLQNTLAFEQRQLAEREAELIKSQKKQERLEKIKALYTSYTNYSNKGDENPILKALRDFAILESITASFGDGGVVEDKLPTNGIFRGQSHNGNKGGIPILVEGREGIFSAREMENLGKDNFYRMKEIAGLGRVDSNFFSGQRQQFIQAVVPANNDALLLRELNEVKKAIESKPVQNWDVVKVADGVIEIVETLQQKNKTIRNHYKTKKPRL